jgi:peptide/nickel transport system substrate-binding protein
MAVFLVRLWAFARRARPLSVLLGAAIAAAAFSTVQAAETPARGGTLKVALRLTVASLDPIYGNAPGNDRKIYNLFAETLIKQDVSGKFLPMLATGWDIQNDGKAIVFKLRRDVAFQDGTPFNAQAVKFNLGRFLVPNVTAPARQYMTDLESVDVVDDYTVRVNLKNKSGVMLSMLAVEPGSMMSPTAIQKDGADFSRKPVGTGPFKIASWSGDQLVAERNPQYWRKAADGKALPYLDRVEIKVVANSAIRIIELKSGNTQLVDFLENKDVAQLAQVPGVALVEGRVPVTMLLAFNVTQPPFDNPRLRKAVALAIDRNALAKVITGQAGGPLSSLEPPGTWVYDAKVQGHPFDIASAREEFKASGFKEPITMTVIQRDPDIQVAQLVQSMLKKAGIEIKVETMERQAYLAKILPHKYQLGLLQFAVLRPDPDVSYRDFFGAQAARNYSGLDTKDLEPVIASARGETDIAKRRPLYSRVQQTVLDGYYISPLFWLPVRDAASSRLRGITRDASLAAWYYDDLWLKP